MTTTETIILAVVAVVVGPVVVALAIGRIVANADADELTGAGGAAFHDEGTNSRG